MNAESKTTNRSNEDKTKFEIGSDEYNNIPIYYCSNCLSICIVNDGTMDYCCDCGDTGIETATLDKYDELRYRKYGKRLFKQ